MNKQKKSIFSIILRYTLVLFFVIFSSKIFYFIFTPLTLYPVFFLIKNFLISNISIYSNIILVGKHQIEIVGACVASSAYLLLLMLNLTTPNIKIIKRALMFFFNFSIFLIINIIRIFLLSLLLINESPFFDITHQMFWYVISTIFVIGIWFLTVKLFEIKEIPFYSDIKFIFGKLHLNKDLKKKVNKS